MRFKLVVVELELSRRQKALASIALVATALLAGAAVEAAPVVFQSGQPLTAEDLNESFDFIVIGRSAFSAEHTTAQLALPSGPTIVFDDELLDVADEYNPATGEFIPLLSGQYLVSCNLIFDAGQSSSGTNQYLEAGVFVNGVRIDVSAGFDNPYARSFGVHRLLTLTGGDTVTCNAYASGGAGVPLRAVIPGEALSSFSAVRLFDHSLPR